MKKFLTSLTLSICLGLVLTTSFLILTPFTAFAGDDCTAKCPGGTSVTCQPDSRGNCWATDGVGCLGAQSKACPKADEELQ